VYATTAGDILGITGFDSLTGQGAGSPLQTGAWETQTYNNMIGPEFGMLFETQRGRWTFSTELKFTAALNFQNNLYQGANFPNTVGADYIRATFNPSVTNTQNGATGGQTIQLTPPPLFIQLYGTGQSNTTNSAEHRFTFSPIGEWRLNSEFRVSEAIRLRAGYTGMWLAGIARASTNTGYRSDRRPTQYAEPKDPSQPASQTNPWVVKTTGTGNPTDPYFRPSPVYNRIGAVNGGNEYVFVNGVDVGIEFRY